MFSEVEVTTVDVMAMEMMAMDVLGSGGDDLWQWRWWLWMFWGVEVMTYGNGDDGYGCEVADKEEADKLHK
jgi:hypothetical protein